MWSIAASEEPLPATQTRLKFSTDISTVDNNNLAFPDRFGVRKVWNSVLIQKGNCSWITAIWQFQLPRSIYWIIMSTLSENEFKTWMQNIFTSIHDLAFTF